MRAGKIELGRRLIAEDLDEYRRLIADPDALRGFFWLGMVVCERCWTIQPNMRENQTGVFAVGCARCGNLTGRYISL